MLFLTKKFHFSASHRLYNTDWDDEKNFKIFGKCANPKGHGHNYTLEVTVSGEPDPLTGYVMDLNKLKEVVNNELIKQVDHKHLNFDVDFMKGINPTVENLLMQFWKILKPKFTNIKLYSLKLHETENNFAEIRE